MKKYQVWNYNIFFETPPYLKTCLYHNFAFLSVGFKGGTPSSQTEAC